MYEEIERNYLKSILAVGIVLGLLGGVTLSILYHRKKTLSATTVLNRIKQSFLKEGSIEGSWISFEKEPIRKFAVHSKAYRGGISRIEDSSVVYYKFLADAYTGTVLDISRKKGRLNSD